MDGQVVRTVADLPLQEEVPISFGSVPTGPREIDWRDDAPATLFWVEAAGRRRRRPRGRGARPALTLAAPFTGDPAPLATLGLRFDGIAWGSDGLALVSEGWFKTPPDPRLDRRARASGKARRAPLRPLVRGPLRRSRASR